MSSTSVAQVRQVLTGHSDRALVTAVDGNGREYKLEVPSADVRDVAPRETVLVLTWSFHPAPLAAEDATPTASPAAPSDPVSRADEEFRAMMPGAPPAAPGERERTLAQRLAEQLGLGGAR